MAKPRLQAGAVGLGKLTLCKALGPILTPAPCMGVRVAD